jgi:ABC-2 type transport system ATP-binding protein
VESASDFVAADRAAVDEVPSPPAAGELPAPEEPTVTVVIDPVPEAVEPGEVTAFLTEADNDGSDGAGTDTRGPVDSPLAWALLAGARREPLSRAARSASTAQVTSSATVTEAGITVDPTVVFVDGIFQGTLNAVSGRGAELVFTALGGSNGGKLDLGTVPLTPTTTDPQSYTILPYANWLDQGQVKGVERFEVRITEVTDFDKVLASIPLVGLFAAPVIDLLQTLPLVSDLLAPVIGSSIVATIDVNVAQDAPGATPLAFTYDVVSFDGVKISTNFFPASGLAADDTAPTVLNGPGLGQAGVTDPYGLDRSGTQDFIPGVSLVRDRGYNLISWDPRGEYASGGILQLDNPFYEGRDTSAIITWAAENPEVETTPEGDPKVGMIGGSYGGGIQLTTASTDPRVDAIVPGIAWNSLDSAIYPDDTFKTGWGLSLLQVARTGARINPEFYRGLLTGVLFGFVPETAQAFFASSGPTSLLNQLKAPTLLIQGIIDMLNPLNEAVANAETITANPWDTPVKMAWFCGGHGFCFTAVNPSQADDLFAATFAWLDQYVKGEGSPADAVPVFQWWDQRGVRFTSDLLPFEDGFLEPVGLTTTNPGGRLGIIPVLGGSGPLSGVRFPDNLVFPTEASNAINVSVTTPTPGDQIVGAPQLAFTYSGLGTGGAVFAQLVDDETGLVVGNVVSPVPVTLDGKERTVSVALNDIAYTAGADASLTLQIVGWASVFASPAIGLIDISDIELNLPLRAVSTLI